MQQEQQQQGQIQRMNDTPTGVIGAPISTRSNLAVITNSDNQSFLALEINLDEETGMISSTTERSGAPTTTAVTTTNGMAAAAPTIATNKKYYKTMSIKELFFFVFLGVLFVIPWALNSIPLWTIRPIPYQLLSNGEYIKNLNHDLVLNHETISDVFLIIYSFVLPLIIQVLIARYYRQNIYEMYSTVCIYIISMGITGFVTELIKNYVGYLRPIFYEVCQPNDTYTNCTSTSSSSVDDAYKSFPSGHASLAFCGLTILTLYIHTKCGLPSITKMQSKIVVADAVLPVVGTSSSNNNRSMMTDERRRQQQQHNNNNNNQVMIIETYYTHHPLLYRIVSLLSLLPMGFALFIAASRVHDNKHFPADIVGGSILGTSIAIFVNGLWL